MASGSGVWAVALTNDPVRKKAVSAMLLVNDTVMLRRCYCRHCEQLATKLQSNFAL
jgi:hypothetical protein